MDNKTQLYPQQKTYDNTQVFTDDNNQIPVLGQTQTIYKALVKVVALTCSSEYGL